MNTPAAAGAEGGGETRPVHVVLVDDDETSLRILESYLKGGAFRLRVFNEPRAALESMERDAPDVLVCDWFMKGMDGPELLRAVRVSPNLQGTYCILITAFDAKGQKVEGLLVGADDYLAKPVSEVELQARIRVGLRVRRLERQAMMVAMAATLGHEINNPLTGLFGFMELARKHLGEGETGRAVEDLARAEEAAERVRLVVARLVAMQDPRLKTLLRGTSVIDVDGPPPRDA